MRQGLEEEFGIDLSKYTVTNKELEEEREEAFKIFRDTMLEFNPELSEKLIVELFNVKFGYHKK